MIDNSTLSAISPKMFRYLAIISVIFICGTYAYCPYSIAEGLGSWEEIGYNCNHVSKAIKTSQKWLTVAIWLTWTWWGHFPYVFCNSPKCF